MVFSSLFTGVNRRKANARSARPGLAVVLGSSMSRSSRSCWQQGTLGFRLVPAVGLADYGLRYEAGRLKSSVGT